MNKTIYILMLVIWANPILSQQLYKGTKNYKEFQKEIEDKISKGQINKSSIKKYERQKYLLEPRLFPSSNLKDYQKRLRENTLNIIAPKEKSSNYPSWEIVGPPAINEYHTDEIFGHGRVNFIKFHPTDLETIFIGTPTGCVWKSINDGEHWEIISENLPCFGYTDMAFDAENPSIMYLLTGDADGGNAPYFGILKTLDGGEYWELLEGPDELVFDKLMAHPTIPNLIYLISFQEVYYSTDGGQTWNIPEGDIGRVYDLEFHPTADNMMYLMERDTLQVSYNNGFNFEYLNDFDGENLGGFRIAVSPSFPEDIYISTLDSISFTIVGFGFGQENRGIYYSNNQGQSFSKIEGSDSLVTAQVGYNYIFDVYPNQDKRFVNGWVNLYFNDEDSWHESTKNSSIHVDQHDVTFDPKNPDCVWIANDGGVYRSCDFGQTWTNKSNNLSITQVYEFSNSTACEDLILMGTQDNGTALFQDGAWSQIKGGDGFSCGFSYGSNETAFWSYQYQQAIGTEQFSKYLGNADDGFSNEFEFGIRPEVVEILSGFVTEFYVSPSQHGLIFYPGITELFRSANNGKNYISLLNNNRFVDLSFSTTNGNLITFLSWAYNYNTVAYEISINTSNDAGLTWSSTFLDSELFDTGSYYYPTAITFDNENLDKVWIVINNLDQNMILQTLDGGQNWSQLNEGLPNVFLNDILYQTYSNDALYLATDRGVYYRDNTMNQWDLYNEGLPSTMMNRLEISNVAQKLRVASFGSGIWETDLYDTSMHPPIVNFDCGPHYICKNESVIFQDWTSFNPDEITWYFDGGTPSTSKEKEVEVTYENKGNYAVTLVSRNENGVDSLRRTYNVFVYENEVNINVQELDDGTFELSSDTYFQNYEWSTGATSSNINVDEEGWYSLTAYFNDQCIATDSIFIELNSTSTENVISTECAIFPNPTNGQIFIDCPIYKEGNFTLYSLTGEKIQTGRIYKESIEIDVLDGFYILEVFDIKRPFSERFKIIIKN